MTKKIAKEYIISLRKGWNMTQTELAQNSGLALRTIAAIESGAPIADKTYDTIYNYICQTEENGYPGADQEIKEKLDGRRYGITKNFGMVEAEKPDEEIDWVQEHEYEGSLPIDLLISDPWGEPAPWDVDFDRAPKKEDYITIRQFAKPIEVNSDNFSNFFHQDVVTFWVPSFKYASPEAYKSIRNFSQEIENFNEISQTSYRKLSELSTFLKKKEALITSFMELNEMGYTIFFGEQILHHSTTYIFFIDESDIEEIRFDIQAVHPRFMKKLIPYYSFVDSRDSSKDPAYLIKRPVKYMIGDLWDVKVMKDAYENEPIFYPPGEVEEKWIELSRSVLNTFNNFEREEFDYFVKQSGFTTP
jgi:DNA-binding XRE family transcriptional regulator